MIKIKQSIQTKLSIILLLATLIPGLIITAWSHLYLSSALLNASLDRSYNQINKIDMWITAQIHGEAQERMKLLRQENALLDADGSLRKYLTLPVEGLPSQREAEILLTFAQYKAAYPDIAFLFLALEDGSYVEYPRFNPTKAYDPTQRPWYTSTLEANKLILGSPYITTVSKEQVVSATAPFVTKSGLNGVLGYTMSIDNLSDNIAGTQDPIKEHFLLIHTNGTLVTSPLERTWISKPASEVFSQALLTPRLALTLTDLNTYQYESGPLYYAYTYTLPESGWRVVVMQNKELLLEPVYRITGFFVAIFVAFLLLWALVINKSFKRFTHPLVQMAKVIENSNYAASQSATGFEQYIKRPDEIGLIARSISKLMEALSAVMAIEGHQPKSTSSFEEFATSALESASRLSSDNTENVKMLLESRLLLSQAQQRLTIATQLTTEAYWDYSVQQQLLYVNPSMANLFDLPCNLSLLSWLPIFTRVQVQQRPLITEALSRLSTGKSTELQLAIALTIGSSEGNSDKATWYMLRAKAIQDESSHLTERIVGVLVNIDDQHKTLERLTSDKALLESEVAIRTTELSAVNQALTATNEELNEALDIIQRHQADVVRSEKLLTLGILVSGVAHEVNTPLGIAITLTSYLADQINVLQKQLKDGLLQRSFFEEFIVDAVDSLDSMALNLQKTASLVESLRIINKEHHPDDAVAFKPQLILEEVLTALKPRLESMGVTVSYRIDIDSSFYGYPQPFNQILSNLILNSLNHSFEGLSESAHIAIRMDSDNEGHQLMIRYSDNGRGIPYQIAKHIFDPFFTTKRGNGGTGLGLYLVYNLVTVTFSGSIVHENLHPHGTAFTLILKPALPHLDQE